MVAEPATADQATQRAAGAEQSAAEGLRTAEPQGPGETQAGAHAQPGCPDRTGHRVRRGAQARHRFPAAGLGNDRLDADEVVQRHGDPGGGGPVRGLFGQAAQAEVGDLGGHPGQGRYGLRIGVQVGPQHLGGVAGRPRRAPRAGVSRACCSSAATS